MESNLGQQAPKLNVTNVSSAVFGKDGPALGEESKIGKLSRILRTTRIKVNNLEKVVGKQEQLIKLTEEKTNDNIKKSKVNAEKITRLKNILQNQKSDIGEKLPGSTAEKEKVKLNTTLEETNRILVEIQKQLAYDFAMRAAEEKKETKEQKEKTSKEKFKKEENALEKTAKNIVSAVRSATKKVMSPLGNIFKKLLAFIAILGKGILANAAFEWFKDPENQKKITKFFNIIKENWQLLAKILATIAGFVIIGKVLALLTAGLALLPALAAGAILAYAMLKQGLGERQKMLVEKLEEMGGVTPENREKLIKQLEKEKAEKMSGPLGGAYAGLTGELAEIDNAIRFLKTGEYGYGESFQFDFGLPFNYQMGGKADPETLQQQNPFGFYVPEQPEARAMGGPVKAGNTYLVGERGPELFSPNIDGSIVNNMRTEKIYQMLASGKRGRTRIVELPPQTIEGPKPEVKLPQGPATKAPKISSSNSLDGYRSVTSEIYGIMV